MKNFPENYELVSFFECEPDILDDDIPWEYNEITFHSKSENGTLDVKMYMGSEKMSVVWSQNKKNVLDLSLSGTQTIEVIDQSKMDTLIVKFRSDTVKNLVIKIRPFISIVWGYDDQH